MRTALLSSALLAAAASTAAAQNQILIAEGDVLPGAGTVRDVAQVAIDDSGNWAAVVWIETVQPTAQALIVNGQVLLGPGDPLPGLPAPHVFLRASSLHFEDSGELLWIANGFPAPGSPGVAAYRGLTPLLAIDQPLVAPGVTPGTLVDKFYEIVPAGPGEVVVHLEADDSAVFGFTDDHIVRLTDQPSGGVAATVVAKRSDVLPGQTAEVLGFTEYNNALAVDGAGEVLFLANMLSGPQAIYRGDQLVAQTGGPTPLFGLSWTSFTRANATVNAAGDVAYTGRVFDGGTSKGMLIWNGQKVAQEGDALAAVAPFVVDELFVGTPPYPAPLHLTDTGGIVWFAGWSDPDPTSDRGLFLDLDLVLREGELFVDGQRVVDLVPTTGLTAPVPTYDVNSDATVFAFRAELEDGRLAAVRVEPNGTVAPIADCNPNAGTLTGSPVSPGAFLVNTVGNAQAAGAVALMALSTSTVTGAPGCGVDLPGLGEQHLSLSPAHLFAVKTGLFAASLPGGSTIVLSGALPADPSLAGFPFFAQAVWIDPAPAAPEPLRATNALAYVLGQ